ncbi:MAG: PQQ-dependent dehydrogenase, methanol/ethanol family [Bryobacteraceae bacterium]
MKLIALVSIASALAAQDGRVLYDRNCSFCHGADAKGGERGPALGARADLAAVIRNGFPEKGMPASRLSAAEIDAMAAHVRSIAGPAAKQGSGGFAAVRAGDWPTYHGVVGGNRHSSLDQINVANVAKLAPQWIFTIPGVPKLQVTPVVLNGVMYVTAPNEAYALDATSGKQLWRFRRPRTQGLAGDAASGINRGVAVLDSRVFLVTDNAHLLALDRANGELLWDTEMADGKQNYGSTSAPLVVKDLVIAGISGGDEGARGFLAAYRIDTGKEVWRFWTIPKPGEPLSETWKGKDLEHGCGTTWLTGTYDASLDLVYWPTGNPCPDYNGDERIGDNLYTDSILALDRATGKLRWYYQYTPHDLWDWDSVQVPMLVDAPWQGQNRKLLLQANRNGFFYVLDRESGKLLRATPFVKKLTWASGIDLATGRPQLLPNSAPSKEGAKTCPAVEGATNWMSTAYSPATGLFYLTALEKCGMYFKAEDTWKPGESYYGGFTKRVPGDNPRKYLRAIDLSTGKVAWDLEQDGPASTWGGVLSTGGGVVFFGHDSGDFAAADARTGKLLWRFPANQQWKASPMTYMSGGKQYVAIASGPAILAFAVR